MRISLLWKILLSTSLSLILLFGITGWLVQNHAIGTTSLNLEAEVQSSLHAYESLWRARTEEKHLSADPAYRDYTRWMARYGPIPRLLRTLSPRRPPLILPAE